MAIDLEEGLGGSTKQQYSKYAREFLKFRSSLEDAVTLLESLQLFTVHLHGKGLRV